MEEGSGSFLHLSDAEKMVLSDLSLKAKNNARTKTIIKYLIDLNDITKIIKLAEFAPRILPWCRDPEFADYWNEIWSYCGRHPTWPEAQASIFTGEYRHLIPQPTLTSFDLVAGMHFFNIADQLIQNGNAPTDKNVQFYLNKALQYHCFEALILFCRYKQYQYEQGIIDLNQAHEAIQYTITKNIPYHGSAACLLLAACELEIALISKQQTTFEQPYNHACLAYFTNALTAVLQAQALDHASTACIHNAYYGRGIAASNSDGWETYADWQTGILGEIDEIWQQRLLGIAQDKSASTTLVMHSATKLAEEANTKVKLFS